VLIALALFPFKLFSVLSVAPSYIFQAMTSWSVHIASIVNLKTDVESVYLIDNSAIKWLLSERKYMPKTQKIGEMIFV